MTVGHQSVESTFIDFCNDSLGLRVTPQDISIIHRISASSKDTVRPIIVRFTNRRTRDAVYRARKLLKDHNHSSRVYISEHLTKVSAGLFYEARQLQRQNKLSSAWTQGGQVYVKFTSDLSVRPTLVKKKLDLCPRA